MKFVLVCPEIIIENEIANGMPQSEIASTYALAMRSADGGEKVDWKRINLAIKERWPKGLLRVKQMAHKILAGYDRAVRP